MTNYPRSKTLAERAAWDFVKNMNGIAKSMLFIENQSTLFCIDGNRFELTVLNPTLVVGPLLMDGDGASITVTNIQSIR